MKSQIGVILIETKFFPNIGTHMVVSFDLDVLTNLFTS